MQKKNLEFRQLAGEKSCEYHHSVIGEKKKKNLSFHHNNFHIKITDLKKKKLNLIKN